MKSKTLKTRVRVGVDFHVWDGIFQGSRSYLIGLYRSAIRLGSDIDFFFFLDDVESLRMEYPEFGFSNVTLVRMKSRSGISRLTWQLPFFRYRYKVDLLHVQYRLPFFFAGACVCTIHDILFETDPQYFKPSFVFQSRLTSKRSAKVAKILFATSNYTRTQIIHLYGIPPDRISTVYSGADFNRFFPAPGGEELLEGVGLRPGAYILTVGRLEPRKNQAALIEAYVHLGSSAPPLVLVGQRDYGYGDLLRQLSDPALKDRVFLFEKMNDHLMSALLRHAKMFVYPSFAEGFGMPVLEAMASGVPVITSDRTSLPEVAGGAAILIDPNSPAELCDAMSTLLNNSKLVDELSKKGLQRAEFFSWDSSAEQMLDSIRNFCQIDA